MRRPPREYLIDAPDDGLPAADVGPWAVEKYRRMGMYAEMFSTGMKNAWGCRVYIDLFAGPGHAVIRERGLRVLTSPLLALTLPDPFDKYILCDAQPEFVEALRSRSRAMAPGADVELIPGDVNELVSDVERRIPGHSRERKVLSFCFVDPFGLDIHFETIRRLGAHRAIDFLVLLALGMDATRNWATYVRPESPRVDLFLGDTGWRSRWTAPDRAGSSPIRFLAEEYAAAMARIGYRRTSLDDMIEIRTYENNMRLYYLAFFSKSEKGYEFWRQVRKYATDQTTLL